MPAGQESQARTVGNWILEQPIGSGSFALVWKARHAQTGRPAAVKEINTDKLNRKLQESLASEIDVMERMSHQNVVGMLDLLKVCVSSGTGIPTY